MKKGLYVCLAAVLLGCVASGYGLHVRSVDRSAIVQPTGQQPTHAPAQSQDLELSEMLFPTRETQEICVFYMDTPDGAYHFIRTAQGVRLDEAAADADSFERMLELMFAIPVQKRARGEGETQDELALTLEYTDGARSSITILLSGKDAWMCLDGGEELHTDAWRIHALMLACDGARVSE